MTVPVVVLDANVLYPSTLRDVLIRLGLAGVVNIKWTDAILDEVFRNLVANRPDLSAGRLKRTRELMNAAIRDVLVEGYEQWLGKIVLPDPADCHVLAAAIQSKADSIITKNLKDFPAAELNRWGISAVSPDCFFLQIHKANPDVLVAAIQEIATAWKAADVTLERVITSLAVEAPRTAELLLAKLK